MSCGVFLPGRLWWPRGAVLLKRKGVPRGNSGALDGPLEVNFIFRRGRLKTNTLRKQKGVGCQALGLGRYSGGVGVSGACRVTSQLFGSANLRNLMLDEFLAMTFKVFLDKLRCMFILLFFFFMRRFVVHKK